jgi:hypothetical protein
MLGKCLYHFWIICKIHLKLIKQQHYSSTFLLRLPSYFQFQCRWIVDSLRNASLGTAFLVVWFLHPRCLVLSVLQSVFLAWLDISPQHTPQCVCITQTNLLMLYFFLIRIVGDAVHWVHSARRPPIGLWYLPRVIMRMDEFGGMMIGRRNRSTRRKPAPVPLCPLQMPHDLTGREAGPPRWEASD